MRPHKTEKLCTSFGQNSKLQNRKKCFPIMHLIVGNTCVGRKGTKRRQARDGGQQQCRRVNKNNRYGKTIMKPIPLYDNFRKLINKHTRSLKSPKTDDPLQ